MHGECDNSVTTHRFGSELFTYMRFPLTRGIVSARGGNAAVPSVGLPASLSTPSTGEA